MLPVPDRSLEDEQASEDEGYQVWHGDGLPPSALRQYIAVICRLCGTRMYGEEDQVGEPITCPDCGTETTLKKPPPDVPAEKSSSIGDEEGYRLQGEGDAYEAEPLAPVI
jgi:DNA-directed RNA polymerase subunit RPC12/RpoP